MDISQYLHEDYRIKQQNAQKLQEIEEHLDAIARALMSINALYFARKEK